MRYTCASASIDLVLSATRSAARSSAAEDVVGRAALDREQKRKAELLAVRVGSAA